MKRIPFEPDWEPIVKKHVDRLLRELGKIDHPDFIVPAGTVRVRDIKTKIASDRMKKLVNEITEHWH